MNILEQTKAENKKIATDINQLAGTEDSRLSVITAVFVRLNNEMRLQNVQDIKKDISYSAKNFGLLPEKYVNNMDSIVKSYIEQTNKFMRAYNIEFFDIQNALKKAEENQKYYFFKIRETLLMKDICAIAGKAPEDYKQLDEEIKKYREKIKMCEQIIIRCDREFEECKIRREQDFKELFELKPEQSLAIIRKQNIFEKIFMKIKNKFFGYESFSQLVLQKYASKINRMRTETIDTYVDKTKSNIVSFQNDIEALSGGA